MASVMGSTRDVDVYNASVHNEQNDLSDGASAVGSGSQEAEVPE
jgi:hypothetical protein